jgi:perosamine synthetase
VEPGKEIVFTREIKNKMIPHSKPFVDRKDLIEVSKQIKSGKHATGAKTKEFEKEFAKYHKVKYSRAVNSGTNAIYLALLSLNIKKGDEVILPSYVCQSVLSAVNYTNAKPVFADVEKGKFNICYETIKKVVSKKTKAIIVPHMFGIPADIKEIKKLKISVIEDCAQSLGAEIQNKKVGSLGDIGIFSFYATKVISTGQGGMIVTNSKKISDKINDLMKYDQRKTYKIAYNFSLSDIQSSLGLNQLKKLNGFIRKRKEIAKQYDSFFKNKFNLIKRPKGSIAFRYLIKFENKEKRKKFQTYLMEKKIVSEQPVFNPLHKYFKLKSLDFKNTEEIQNNVLSLPIYPALKKREIKKIIKKVLKFTQ